MNESPGRGLIAAGVAFTIALFVFGNAVVRAVATEPVTPTGPTDHGDVAGPGPAPEPMSTEALMLAVDNDPFRPDRQRPEERYRLPGDVGPEPEPAPPLPPPLPIFLLHGTIVDPTPGRSVALIQYGEEGIPALLPVGSVIGGYRISEVMPEAATVTNGEREIFLRVPGPLQVVVEEEPQQRGRQNARERRGAEPAPPSGAQQEQQRQRLMQLMQQLERARESGAPPQVLQALEVLLQGVANGGDVRIRTREVAPARRVVPDTMSTGAPGAPDLR